MAVKIRIEKGPSQEPRTPTSPCGGGNQTGNTAARIQTSTPIQDASNLSGGLTLCTTSLALHLVPPKLI